MEPIPLPSHIHYELLLQLLERQSSVAAGQLATGQRPSIQDQVQQLIITLRKAMAQQKQIEATCERQRIEIDYRWSLNRATESASSEPVVPANSRRPVIDPLSVAALVAPQSGVLKPEP
jgi:hypothetical protein